MSEAVQKLNAPAGIGVDATRGGNGSTAMMAIPIFPVPAARNFRVTFWRPPRLSIESTAPDAALARFSPRLSFIFLTLQFSSTLKLPIRLRHGQIEKSRWSYFPDSGRPRCGWRQLVLYFRPAGQAARILDR